MLSTIISPALQGLQKKNWIGDKIAKPQRTAECL